MQQPVAAQLIGMPAIASAVSSAALGLACPPHTVLTRASLRNYHGRRPGDSYVVIELRHFINKFDELRVASMREARWKYGSCEPAVFAVGKLTAQTRSRPIAPYDIVPTLASYPGIAPPLGWIGCPVLGALV